MFQEGFAPQLMIAGSLMGLGSQLHLAERHDHEYRHEPMSHKHPHYPDIHHRHGHAH